MKLALLLLLPLLSACAVTPEAALRREAYGRLRTCAGPKLERRADPYADAACLAESRRFCSAHGLEATCGSDEFYSRR